MIIFFVFKDFIFLKKIYLFKDIGSDSINFSYPYYYSLANYFAKEGIPTWSFNQGMGQNIFPLWIADPFSFFIMIMGKKLVYQTIFYAELLKIFFAGLFFYLFLKKIELSEYTSIIGSLLYSFSGFIILGGQWNIFSTQAVYVALSLYAFEKLYRDNNWILFPVSIFLIASNQPLDLYFIGLFLVIYIIFRLLEKEENDPKKIMNLLIKLVSLGAIGVAMSSFFFINGLQVMLE
ncbi:MAG: YfhO family protein, partial [Smithella sp.]